MNSPDESLIRFAAVLTCHNRREKTLACLRSLQNQMPEELLSGKRWGVEVFLTDDGSIDRTSEAVLRLWPGAQIISGDGSLFWCGGMRAAWTQAAKTDPDYYVLINDDTTLYPDAIGRLLELTGPPSSLVIGAGAVCDPSTGAWTYGGVQSDFPFPMPDGKPRPCGTLNMNVALVPRAIFKELGMLHREYRHAMGDLDYGLMARRRGFEILETPEFVGECLSNPLGGTWRDSQLSRWARLKKLCSVKGLPPRDWLAYTRRNCGRAWLRYFLSPYLRIILNK